MWNISVSGYEKNCSQHHVRKMDRISHVGISLSAAFKLRITFLHHAVRGGTLPMHCLHVLMDFLG